MRIHPDFAYQTVRHNVKNFHSRCEEAGRLHCPFDEVKVQELDYCKTCTWNRKHIE